MAQWPRRGAHAPLLLVLLGCVLLASQPNALAASSTHGEAPMKKDRCVEPEELELIKDGMMLVYADKNEEAAG